MNGTTAEKQLVLRPKVLPAILVVALAGLTGGLMLWGGGKVGWLFVTVALLACIGTISELFPRNWLWLSPEGFRYGTFWVVSRYRWSDIAGFSVQLVRQSKRGRPRVVFSFSASCRERPEGPPKILGLFPYPTGHLYDCCLRENYGMPPKQLAELLESWRINYGTHPG